MEETCENRNEPQKAFLHEDGKTYFSKSTERKFFFFLTLVMMVWGILSKLGLF